MMRRVYIAAVSLISLAAPAADLQRDADVAAPVATPSAAPAPAPGSGKPDVLLPPQQWIGVTETPYGPMMVQLAPPPPYRDYQMNRVIGPEEKQRWLQTAMPVMANMMRMDARAAVNYFAFKIKARSGLSFDEVVESMMLRANRVNLKFVGSNQMWKDFKAVLNDTTAPRIEVFSFCDIAVARDLLRIIPEMAVFMPCRITVMEDADQNIWVMMLDWDVTGLDLAGAHMGITPELRQGAIEVHNKMNSVMQAAANGEF